ncbi:MAG TPA: thiamine-phosphate kinase [Solirubrobacterales bacterium]|jgi:thiamine-monophosphate kinase
MGEFDLLARLRARLPPPGARVRVASGDDAAVSVPGGATATSVDALVDGVHFRRSVFSPAQIGRKSLSVALSDLAAMGAEPGEAYVALGVPEDLDEEACIELLDGILEVAAETGTTLAGGDLTRAPVLVIAVTVVGHSEDEEGLVTRSGASEGDVLVVTGELGGGAAGLLALEGRGDGTLPREILEGLRARQLDPRPRLAAGRALAEAGATAMIDLSDGVAGDLRRVAEGSGVGAVVECGEIPLAAGVDDLAAAIGRDPLELAVSGGEDYELLAALPERALEDARTAVEACGLRLSRIGRIGGDEVELRLPGGGALPARGYDQLA